jgi:hypothetical protein
VEKQRRKLTMSKYLDKEGLIYLWSKIKVLLDAKTNITYKLTKTDSTITLTGSDGSTTSVQDSNTTYTTATSSADGLMSKSDKATFDAIPNTYAKKTDLASVYKYQGSVSDYASLPANSTVGYVYNVESNGHNYAWTGSEWDDLGGTMTIETITNSEIDTIMSS